MILNVYYFVQVFNQISTNKTDEEQLEEAVNMLSVIPLNKEELIVATKLYYRKVFLSLHYKPKQKLNGLVTLITAKDKFEPIVEDYGMRAVSITYLINLINFNND